jgi:hypothetical protein
MNDRLDRLERLEALRHSGALSDVEFAAEKARILVDERAGGHPSTKALLAVGAAMIVVAAMVASWWQRPASTTGTRPAAAPAPIRTLAAPSAPVPALSPQAALAAAGRVVFPEAGAVPFRAEKLIPVGDHLAVIGVGEGDGSHASGGTLAIQYVDQAGRTFTKVGPMVAEQTGSFGTIGGWTLRHDLGDRPIIALDGGGTFQGCTFGGTTLIALDADRPRTLASLIPTSFADDSASDHGPSYEGRITRAGDGIAVRYSGSVTATILFRRVGAALVPDRPLPAGC